MSVDNIKQELFAKIAEIKKSHHVNESQQVFLRQPGNPTGEIRAYQPVDIIGIREPSGGFDTSYCV